MNSLEEEYKKKAKEAKLPKPFNVKEPPKFTVPKKLILDPIDVVVICLFIALFMLIIAFWKLTGSYDSLVDLFNNQCFKGG
jgi:hypothetical protein